MIKTADNKELLKDMPNILSPKQPQSCIKKSFTKDFGRFLKRWDISIYSVMKKFGLTKKKIKKYFDNPSIVLNDEQKSLCKAYWKSILDECPQCGEKFMNRFLYCGRYSKMPFGDFLGDLGIKYNIAIMFGDKDWMTCDKISKKIEHSMNKKYQAGQKSKLRKEIIIENSGHQILLDNPLKCAQKIIE